MAEDSKDHRKCCGGQIIFVNKVKKCLFVPLQLLMNKHKGAIRLSLISEEFSHLLGQSTKKKMIRKYCRKVCQILCAL